MPATTERIADHRAREANAPSAPADRRRSPRRTAQLDARYRLPGQVPNRWHPCDLIEVSQDGARLVPHGPAAKVTQTLDLDVTGYLPEDGHINLRCTVRHVTPVQGHTTIGVEFDGVSSRQRLQLRRLLAC